MNLLNFARMCWQLKDYNFEGSSVHIINILKGHILPYSNIWRRRSLKSGLFSGKVSPTLFSRNQNVPIYHLRGKFLYVFVKFCAHIGIVVLCRVPRLGFYWTSSLWGYQKAQLQSIQATFIQHVHCNIKIN